MFVWTVHHHIGRGMLDGWCLPSLGEYFLAELIASQDDHHRTVVADVSNNK